MRGFGARLDERSAEQQAPSVAGSENEIAPLVKRMRWRNSSRSRGSDTTSPLRSSGLGNSAAFNRLAIHHTLRLAAQTNEHALDRVLEWLALWLEARGLTIHRREQLVYMPGYQALYFRSDAAQWP
jgi:hypothetical protein